MPDVFQRSILIEKTDEERRIAYGWAYVTKDAAGVDVIDHSGQFTTIQEIEKAAEAFIDTSRVSGAVHKTKAGGVVHSVVVSDEVAEVLGIVSKQRGWFIGVRVDDDDAWEKVKTGVYKAFSIGGSADVEVIDG